MQADKVEYKMYDYFYLFTGFGKGKRLSDHFLHEPMVSICSEIRQIVQYSSMLQLFACFHSTLAEFVLCAGIGASNYLRKLPLAERVISNEGK